MEQEIIFEQELETPENWETDNVFILNENGELVKHVVPNDELEEE